MGGPQYRLQNITNQVLETTKKEPVISAPHPICWHIYIYVRSTNGFVMGRVCQDAAEALAVSLFESKLWASATGLDVALTATLSPKGLGFRD